MISLPADSVIDWAAVLNVVWAGLVGGVGVTASFSLALLGTTRAADLRRDGRMVAAGAYAVLAAVCAVVVVGAVAFGVIIMTSKS